MRDGSGTRRRQTRVEAEAGVDRPRRLSVGEARQAAQVAGQAQA